MHIVLYYCSNNDTDTLLYLTYYSTVTPPRTRPATANNEPYLRYNRHAGPMTGGGFPHLFIVIIIGFV